MDTILWLGLLMAIFGIGYLVMSKGKKDSKKVAGIAGVIGLVIFFLGGGFSMFGGGATDGDSLSFGDVITGDTTDEDAISGDDCYLDSMTYNARNKYTGAGTGDDFELYDLGADVTKSTTAELVKVDVSSGTVTSTTAGLYKLSSSDKTNDLWFEGSTTYYNEKVPDWHVDGNCETGKGVIVFGDSNRFYDAIPYGTLTDFNTASTNSGLTDSGTDAFTFNATSLGDSSWYGEWELGNSAGNTEILDYTMCLVDDSTADLEGDEVTSFTVAKKSGDTIDKNGVLSGDLTAWWTSMAGSGAYVCKVLADSVGANELGTYRVTTTIDASQWATSADEDFSIQTDDLGGFKVYQYPDPALKATVSGVTFTALV